jgi:hypothetical protein
MVDELARRKGSPDAVWEVYSKVEKAVAVLKFKLDYETPGVSIKLPKAAHPEKLVEEAEALMARAVSELESGEFERAVETLRAARNNLRSVLTPSRGLKKRS